jgi:hypothetical protein
MLTADPKDRIKMAEILTHPWTCDGFSGPPSPQVPERAPLPSDSVLDPEVLEKMKKVYLKLNLSKVRIPCVRSS